MSKPLLATTILLSLCAAPAAFAEPPSEPERTLDAIGADVTSRAQWFGNAIDHVLGEEPASAAAAAPSRRPAAEKTSGH